MTDYEKGRKDALAELKEALYEKYNAMVNDGKALIAIGISRSIQEIESREGQGDESNNKD